MKTSSTIEKISKAILLAQKETTNAIKDAKNPFFKSTYADLNSVREAVMPALNKHGISVLQVPTGDVLETTLLHESGEFISSEIKIVSKVGNDPQAYGSALTYARRYALAAMLCIGAEDDDGNAASGHAGNGQEKKQSSIPGVVSISKQPVQNNQSTKQITVEALGGFEVKDKAKAAGFKYNAANKKWIKDIVPSEMENLPFEVKEV